MAKQTTTHDHQEGRNCCAPSPLPSLNPHRPDGCRVLALGRLMTTESGVCGPCVCVVHLRCCSCSLSPLLLYPSVRDLVDLSPLHTIVLALSIPFSKLEHEVSILPLHLHAANPRVSKCVYCPHFLLRAKCRLQ